MSNLPANTYDASMLNTPSLSTSVGGDEGFLYLKMDKTGSWMFGRDDDEVEAVAEWAVNPFTTQKGYINWGDMGGAPLGEEMRPFFVGEQVSKASLPPTGFDWKDQLSFQMMCVAGEDTGTAVLYKSSSIGGVKAIAKLVDESKAKQASGSLKIFPVIRLEARQDTKSKYKTWYPELKQVEWLDAAGFQALTSGGETAEQIEEPAPEPTPEPVAPARKRRTRRTAA